MVKFEFNQSADFVAEPLDRRGNPASIEKGSAVWSVMATDADGNDVSESLVLTVDPENELAAKLTSMEVELTGVLTLRADGDPDADETAPLVATADIVVDASNAVVLSLTNTEPVDA